MINETKNLAYYRYIFQNGRLTLKLTGTYNREITFSLSLDTAKITAYNSSGTAVAALAGYGQTMSGYQCHIPYTASMGEYWNITIGGATERYEFSSQAAALKNKYWESHKKFVQRYSITSNGTAVGLEFTDKGYFLVEANRTGALRPIVVKTYTDDGGVGLTNPTLYLRALTSRNAYGIMINGSFTEGAANWTIKSNPTSLEYTGGRIDITVSATALYRKIWEDGYVETNGDNPISLGITGVLVICNDGGHAATKGSSDSDWYFNVPADERGGIIRIVPTASNGATGSLEITLKQGSYGTATITEFRNNRVPAKGGTISSADIYWSIPDSTGTVHTGYSTVSFTAVTIGSLGTTPQAAAKTVKTVSVTYLAKGKTFSADVPIILEANVVTSTSYSVDVWNLGYRPIGGSGGTTSPTVDYTIYAVYTYSSGSPTNATATTLSATRITYAISSAYTGTTLNASTGVVSKGTGNSSFVSEIYLGTVTVKVYYDIVSGTQTCDVYQAKGAPPAFDKSKVVYDLDNRDDGTGTRYVYIVNNNYLDASVTYNFSYFYTLGNRSRNGTASNTVTVEGPGSVVAFSAPGEITIKKATINATEIK